MNISRIDIKTNDTGALLKELKSMVDMRDKMGGPMYWNICNDDAHAIANRLLSLGVDRGIIQEIFK